MVFTLIEIAFNLRIFTHASVTHSKLHVNFFENLFPTKMKVVEESMICFIKIQLEKMKMTWNISLFIFCMICNFVMWWLHSFVKDIYQIVWYYVYCLSFAIMIVWN